MHGSVSGTPRERSVSPHPPPQSAPVADGNSELEIVANGAPSSSLSSSSSAGKGKDKDKDKDKDKEPMGLRRAARKLSLNAPMFGLGLGFGLGGREKDREKERDVGKKDDGKKLHKMRMTGTALSSSSAALASAAQ